jgi:hypothetical protein
MVVALPQPMSYKRRHSSRLKQELIENYKPFITPSNNNLKIRI